ncbi:MAG: Cna B-type domain-containing protein, partial [Lachnospiraceae bacterium]|nr:Cna B-type domain-containing protein [Lachnospiraceae bacterium]
HEFRFRVTIDKTGANGAVIADSNRTVSYGNGITFRNNVAEFTLHNGETKIITGLPTGLNYTVEELKEAVTDNNAFTTDHFTTVVTDGTVVAKDKLGTDAVAASTGTISATESSAAFQNTRNTKKLTINKTLTNAIPADDGDIFYFDVMLAGEDDKALRPDNATQIKVAGTAVATEKGTGEHPLYYDAEARIIHNVPVTWNAATETASAGGSVEITGLPVGTTYSISERGWTVETTSDYIEQVSDNVENQTLLNDASVVFTNNRKTSALTVTKKITSNVNEDTNHYFWFKVELPGSGIADGTYDETGVTNTPKNGILTFSNNVAYVKLKANETAAAYNLPSDLDYTVTEIRTEAEFDAIPEEIRGSETFDADYYAMFDPTWETSVTTAADTATGDDTEQGSDSETAGRNTSGNGAVTEGKTQDAATMVAFTNTRKTGDLNLNKVIYSGIQSEKDAYYFFKVELKTAEGAAAGSKVAVNGTYDVTIDGTTKKVTFKNGQAVIPVKGDSTVVLKGLPVNVEYMVTEVEAQTADIDGTYTNGYTAAKFNKSGEVTADDPGTVATSGNAVTITNIHKVSIPVRKDWADEDNQDGIRPASITVELYAKSGSQKEPVSTKKTLTLEGDTWTGSFDDLNLYGSYDANGNYSGGNDRIEYSVRETATPAGYTVTPANGTIAEINPANTTAETAVITNSHVTETVEVKGEKIWKDANNQDGIRPRSITVNLMNGSTRVESKTVEAGRDGKWTFSFTGLPKNENGSEIPYTVTENPVRGYDAPVITGSISEGFRITNPHVTATVHISGTKTWNDEDNEDGSRPTSIVVKLLADGRETARRTVQEDAYGNWTYDFGDLPMNRNGKKITYVIAEDPVEGYETAVNGYNLTNTHEPEESPTPTSESGSGSDRTRRRNQGLDVDGDTDITENNDLYYTDSEGVRRRRSDGAPVDKDGNVIGPPLYGSSVTGSSPAVSRGTSPKTGDTNAPLPFILMMLGAMLSIGGVFSRTRRN